MPSDFCIAEREMLFSIVTPTRNNLPDLKKCVGSVRAQSSAEWEHLVHDAVSEDGTTEWLSTQSGVDAVSEPDAGPNEERDSSNSQD